MDDLKPCPHCGWESIEVAYDSDPVRYFVRCQDCEARTGNHEKPSTAILAWNSRPTPDAAGIVERLRYLAMSLRKLKRIVTQGEAETITEAATTIAAQAAEIERLREALALAAQLPLMSEAAREHATPWGILTVEERLDRITRNAERHDAAVIAARNLTGAS